MIAKFKSAMSSYPTGITCILTKNKTNSYSGIIVNSFASVSLKPLIVLWNIDEKSKKFKVFNKSKNQTIVILSYNQKEIVNEIAFKNAQVDEKKYIEILKQSICYKKEIYPLQLDVWFIANKINDDEGMFLLYNLFDS